MRRLDAIENLGSMDILCTDKTGTLTEGIVALADATDGDGRSSASVRHVAFLNAAFETGIDNPLDAAVVTECQRGGLTTGGFRKVDEIPYDFQRKRLTIVVGEEADPSHHLMLTKGAFQNVLAVCTSLRQGGDRRSLSRRSAGPARGVLCGKGRRRGFRVLAVASRRLPAKPAYVREDEAGMTFLGFLLFVDPPKQGVADTHQRPEGAGCPHQDHQRRQSLRHRPSRRGGRARPEVHARRRRPRQAQGRSALEPGAPHRSFRRGRSAAEGAHRPRPAAYRPRRRLSRRRHQRRSVAPLRRRRHLGRGRRRRRPRQRRHRPSQARPRRTAPGRRERAAARLPTR